MDLKEKLKNLDEEDLQNLTEESEIQEDDDISDVMDESTDKPEIESDKLDDDNVDEGSEIEEDTIGDEITDQEFEQVNSTYKTLSRMYSVVSDYKNISLRDALAAIYQYTDSSYQTAKNNADTVNHCKGRQRYVSSDNQAAAYNFQFDEGLDEYDVKELNKIVISILQQFIDDHDVDKITEELSDVERKANIDSIKVVLILMISCNKYDYFPSLSLPKYAQKWIVDVMQDISDSQESVFNDWINYLMRTKNNTIADKCIEIGYNFFKVSKAIDTFGKYFTKEELASIKKYPEVYQSFLEHRDKFNKLSNGVNYKMLYPMFDITDDAFSKRKPKVISEFIDKYSDMTEDPKISVDALKEIFLENTEENNNENK